MNKLTTTIFSRSAELPPLCGGAFFHSETLFRIYEQTPRMRPFMAVVTNEAGRVRSQLLAVVCYRMSLLPPYLYRHCRIYGEGAYAPGSEASREQLFELMLKALGRRIQRKVLYTEISNLSNKMFGYRVLKAQRFFPVKWMSIHNSLHNKRPEERLGERTRLKIAHALQRGAVTREVHTEEDLLLFYRLMNRHNLLKPRRYIPGIQFFRGLMGCRQARLFITLARDKVVGCCACVSSGGNAYLWYSAFLRKTYVKYHPDTITMWQAIKDAEASGQAHIFFMDVGLPYMRNPFREFILRFGGKPVSTFRWFHTNIPWANRLMEVLKQ